LTLVPTTTETDGSFETPSTKATQQANPIQDNEIQKQESDVGQEVIKRVYDNLLPMS
jgi:hypothetical protein